MSSLSLTKEQEDYPAVVREFKDKEKMLRTFHNCCMT
jgi:hypothetical protein